MALQDMMAELRGSVPKLPFAFTKTLINRSWRDIRESNLWSFNLFESSWITPPVCTLGTVTATQGLATITFDATAIAALLASVIANIYSPLTLRQFRIGSGGIYNIQTLDPGFAANGIVTLDRIFGDPTAAGAAYQVYQLYYAPPFKDHRTWLSVRNPLLFLNLDLTKTRSELDREDPQRLIYQFPTRVVAAYRDTRVGSATLGYPLYELWGQPVSPFTYQCYGLRMGADLINPSDALPQPLDEDLLLAKAKFYAYEWAEANRDISPRSTGPDWKFLMGETSTRYGKLLSLYRKQDREFVDNWFAVRDNVFGGLGYPFYNTIAGVASTIGTQ